MSIAIGVTLALAIGVFATLVGFAWKARMKNRSRGGTMETTADTTAARALIQAAPMQAVLQSGYGSSEVLRSGTTARPTPAAGEVLVRVHAAGIDRGTWHLMTGRPYLMRIMGFGFRGPKNPVPGLDLAGTVVEFGTGVTRFRVGDAVFGIGQGSFAEYARAREDKLAHKPQALTLEQAAVLAVSGGTALQALREAGNLQPGERVLIVGASGGVGTYAVQLAKAFGAEVTAVASGRKLETVRSLGADHVIDYRQQDFADGTQRYDLILDVGGNTPLQRLRRALAPTGRLVFVGGEQGGDITAGMGRILHAFALQPFVRQRFIMLNSREHFSHMLPLAELADDAKLVPVIDRHVDLGGVPAGIDALVAGEVVGKIVVTVA
jgi:NADPH:quinone reductase-like Zn-dependent oxidoreductase